MYAKQLLDKVRMVCILLQFHNNIKEYTNDIIINNNII